MLVLTRKVGESINIGEEIKIRIIETKGRSVRVGIEAPRTMQIHREEVFVRIQDENLAASDWQKTDMEKLGGLLKNLGAGKK